LETGFRGPRPRFPRGFMLLWQLVGFSGAMWPK
jgi:hypothetical protein